jgi:hypothetical protein
MLQDRFQVLTVGGMNMRTNLGYNTHLHNKLAM